MKLRFSPLDLRSLLIVLFAFIGNAQVKGVDLALVTIVPILVVTSMGRRLVIHKLNFGLLLFFSALLLAAGIQASYVDVPYFQGYVLWPWKALILMILVGCSHPPKWTTTNMAVLVVIALSLIAVGRFEGGRLFSVFGPNMLYRLFGIIALFSAMQSSLIARRPNKVLGLATFSLGVFGLALTGSSGAIVVFFVIALYYLYKRLQKLFLGVMIGAGIVGYAAIQQLANLPFLSDTNLAFISRSFYKLGTLETDGRLVGLTAIFTEPFVWLGSKHSDFNSVWFFGYEYPHNIFAELYAFFGIIGVMLITVILFTLGKITRKNLASDVYFLTFVVLFIGSNLSGDLSDNFGVIGLAAGLLLRPHLVDRTHNLIRNQSEQRNSSTDKVW